MMRLMKIWKTWKIVEDVEDMPFSVIENVPANEGCEKKKNNNDRKACMSEKMQKLEQDINKDILASDLGNKTN